MTLGPLMCDIGGSELTAEDVEILAHPFIGGVILFSRNYDNPDQLTSLVSAIHDIRNPPLLVAVDQEGGRVQRLRGSFTKLPAAHLIGRQHDVDREHGRHLAERAGWMMASELRAVDIDMSFAPVLDLDWGLSEVIGDRAFHRDPDVVAELGFAFMSGMRTAGMAATGKHFPGHGHVVKDSHKTLPGDRRPAEDLADDLLPFERLIEAGLPAIMTAHVAYPAIDERPAGFSTAWIRGSLRDRLHFGGAVISDDLSMEAAAVAGDMTERAEAALNAGCDMLLVCNDRPAVVQVLEDLGQRVDPVSQVRLASLHGKGGQEWQQLVHSDTWREAREALRQVLDQPPLELDA